MSSVDTRILERIEALEAREQVTRREKDWIATVSHHGDQIDGLLERVKALEVVAKRADLGVGILTGSTEEAVHKLQERIEALEGVHDISAAVRMLETELERRRDWKATYNAIAPTFIGATRYDYIGGDEVGNARRFDHEMAMAHEKAVRYADRAHGPLERDDSAELAAYERERDQLRAELQLEHAKNNAWHKRGEVLQAEVERLRAETLAAWTEGTLAADKAMGESLAAAKASCAEMARSESIAKTQLRELREAAVERLAHDLPDERLRDQHGRPLGSCASSIITLRAVLVKVKP